MKEDVEKIRDGLYVRKGKMGWMIVRPIKNEDGTINWKHLIIGDPYMTMMAITFLIVILMFYYGVGVELRDQCEANIDYLIENACEVCTNQQTAEGGLFRIDLPNKTMEAFLKNVG